MKKNLKEELNIIRKNKEDSYTVDTKYDKTVIKFQCLKLSKRLMKRKL